jgi:drug/metabolite transporter (DMT)-like permease
MTNHNPGSLDRPTRYGLIVLAVAQGYALYFLHLAFKESFWPATDLQWLYGFYSMFIGLPAFFYLGTERLWDRRNGIAAGVFGVLLFLLGWHLGWVTDGKGVPNNTPFHFAAAYAFSFAVVVFILAFFFRAWCQTGRLSFDYRRLLTLSWHYALTMLFLGSSSVPSGCY